MQKYHFLMKKDIATPGHSVPTYEEGSISQLMKKGQCGRAAGGEGPPGIQIALAMSGRRREVQFLAGC